MWIIRGTDHSEYAFVLIESINMKPNESLEVIKIPDATPRIVARYALSDEQALLTRLRYNRLVDIFTGVTCYSLQNHLRTTVNNVQIETDELYVGVNKHGTQFVFPVQAKGGRDRIGVTQIEQDVLMCADKFPELVCRPIAAQFMSNEVIALFEYRWSEGRIQLVNERHYGLVHSGEIPDDDFRSYQLRGFED